MRTSREILETYQIRAKKSLGQNFLIDEDILSRIATATPVSEKNILEVGPGYGALTTKLISQKPKHLILLELDSDMIDILRAEGIDEVADIYQTDVLEYTPSFEVYSVIANIPYYITSPILRRFLYDLPNAPEEMVILMQEDVAKKITAKKSSLLSLMIAKKSHATLTNFVPAKSFVPAPKVDSAVVVFTTYGDYESIDDEAFLKVVQAGFRSPRKKLLNNFTAA